VFWGEVLMANRMIFSVTLEFLQNGRSAGRRSGFVGAAR
jgi:hypothetical protein